MCAIISGLCQAGDQTKGFMYAKQALSKVRGIVGSDRSCCSKNHSEHKTRCPSTPWQASHSGALSPHNHSGQIPWLEGKV